MFFFSGQKNRDSTVFFLVLIIFFIALLPHFSKVKAEYWGYWAPLEVRESEETGLERLEREMVVEVLEDILHLYEQTQPLNPPLKVQIQPVAQLHSPFSLTSEGKGPTRASLDLRMFFPRQGIKGPTGSLQVRLNNPETLLGKPIAEDGDGRIYLLPPVIEQTPGGDLFSRSAHPVGYEEEFPSFSFFPLWSWEIETFLRSVIRPTFALSESSVITILTPSSKPYWKPVSQERWIKGLMVYAQNEIDAFIEAVEVEKESEVTQAQIDSLQRQISGLKAQSDPEAIIEQHEQGLQAIENLIEMAEFHLEQAQTEQEKDMWEETLASHQENLHNQKESLDERLKGWEKATAEVIEFGEKLIKGLMAVSEIGEEVKTLILEEYWAAIEERGKELGGDYLVFLARVGRARYELEKELASLSPTERNAPAYGFDIPPTHPFGPHQHLIAMDYDAERPSGLVSPDTEGSRALVSINPEFFDPDLPPTAIQLITVRWWERTDALHFSEGWSHYHEARRTMMENLWNNLDWNRLEQLLY